MRETLRRPPRSGKHKERQANQYAHNHYPGTDAAPGAGFHGPDGYAGHSFDGNGGPGGGGGGAPPCHAGEYCAFPVWSRKQWRGRLCGGAAVAHGRRQEPGVGAERSAQGRRRGEPDAAVPARGCAHGAGRKHSPGRGMRGGRAFWYRIDAPPFRGSGTPGAAVRGTWPAGGVGGHSIGAERRNRGGRHRISRNRNRDLPPDQNGAAAGNGPRVHGTANRGGDRHSRGLGKCAWTASAYGHGCPPPVPSATARQP